MESNQFIAVVGLGYVGLPLAVAFAKKYAVVGFDTNQLRIEQLRKGYDHTMEIEETDLSGALSSGPGLKGLYCTNKISDIEVCNHFIVTVPTPTDKQNNPDLTLLFKASEMIGSILKKAIWLFMNLLFIPVLLKKNVHPFWKK